MQGFDKLRPNRGEAVVPYPRSNASRTPTNSSPNAATSAGVRPANIEAERQKPGITPAIATATVQIPRKAKPSSTA